jgi:hypothetical protein
VFLPSLEKDDSERYLILIVPLFIRGKTVWHHRSATSTKELRSRECFVGHPSASKPHVLNIAGLVFDDTAATPMGFIKSPIYAESPKLDSIPVSLEYLSWFRKIQEYWAAAIVMSGKDSNRGGKDCAFAARE